MSSPHSASVQRLLASFPGVSSAPVLVQSTPKTSRPARKIKKASSTGNTPKRHSPTNCFASGSFTESPSAAAIPPPPVTWVLEEDQSGSESDVSCTTDSTSSSRDEMKTPVYSEAGFRVNPMQLIAAVTSAA